MANDDENEFFFTGTDGKEYDMREFQKVTWKGRKTSAVLDKAELVTFHDGDQQVEAKTSEMGQGTHYVMMELAFPG